MTAIRTAIVGWGMSGACFHAPILADLPEFEIAAVVSARPEAVAADLPGVAVYPTVEALLAASDVELVVVASRNHEHFPQARAALAAGRHVVVEKPFVLSSREGLELDRLARAAGRMLAVYQVRRFDADVLTLARVTGEGAIGRPHTLVARYDRWRPQVRDRWRERPGPGAGILWDLGPHLVDRALGLLGVPRTVSARLATMRPGAGAVDHFHLVLGFEHATAVLHADCLTLGPGPSLELHGDRGSFVKYGLDGQEILLRQRRGPSDPAWGREDDALRARLTRLAEDGSIVEETVPTEPGAYQRFYLGVADAIRRGGASPVDAIAATRVVRVLEAAEISDREGRVVAFADPALEGATEDEKVSK